MQDVERGVMIAVQDYPATSTNMCSNTERFFDNRAAVGTFLGGPMRRNCNHRNVVQVCIAFDPLEKDSPSCIMDRFGKFAVTDHVSDLKVFIGNQVARRDIRVCRLSGKILTLPLNLQMLRGQSFSGFLPISRFLLFAGETTLESLQLVLSFAIVAWVLDRIAFRVGQVRFQSNVNPQLFARRDMLDFPLGIDTELAVVPICTPNDTNPLDILDWEGFYLLFLVSNQTETAYPTTVCEGDMTAIIIKLPATGLVLHAPVVVLESWVSLLPWLFVLAIVIEAEDGKISTVGTGLTGHGIEAGGERIFLGKYSTVGLQVVLRDAIPIHPQAQALVTDELGSMDSLFDGGKLLLAPIQLVLVDQHALLLAFLLSFDMLLYGSQDLSIERAVVLFSHLSYLFQQMLREPDSERLNLIFHATILSLTWLHVNRLRYPCAQAPKKVGPFIPRMNDGGFLGR